jgi:predicted nucleic-acid-binding protein
VIGVDTNVLVRAVLDDDPKEANIAKKLLLQLSDNKKLFISSYAILEMIWVLKMKGLPRQTIYASVLDLMDSNGVVIGNREIIRTAIERYSKGKADFGDYLIISEGEFHDTPKLASFDKTLCKEEKFCQYPAEFLL